MWTLPVALGGCKGGGGHVASRPGGDTGLAIEVLCVLVDPRLSLGFTGTPRDFCDVLLSAGIGVTPSPCANGIPC